MKTTKKISSKKNEVKKQIQSEANKKLVRQLKSIGYPGLAKLIAPYNGKTTARIKV